MITTEQLNQFPLSRCRKKNDSFQRLKSQKSTEAANLQHIVTIDVIL